MSKFNGYKNWNQWNVSLWINNDEYLYKEASFLVNHYGKHIAASELLSQLQCCGNHKTPDGAPYSYSSIRAALVGL